VNWQVVRRDASRRTLRRRLFRLGGLALATELALVGIMVYWVFTVAISGIRASNDRVLQYDAANLLLSLQAQDRAIHDYAANGDLRYVAPFSPAKVGAEQAEQRLRQDSAGTPWSAQVSKLIVATEQWEQWADGMRSRVSAAGGPLEDTSASQRGAALYQDFSNQQGALVAELDLDAVGAGASAVQSGQYGIASLVVGAIVVGLALTILIRRMVALGLTPVRQLAGAAGDIARGYRHRIPHTERVDEIGELAGALRAWQDVSAEREFLIQHAPLGICRLDQEGELLSVNTALEVMLDRPAAQLVGRPLLGFLQSAELPHGLTNLGELQSVGRVSMETRVERDDGSRIWCSATVGPLGGVDAEITGSVAIIEDVTERRAHMERAAAIQRLLLPRSPLAIGRYELAGACVAAQDMSGDFFDWMLHEDGHLDITVADVMGKGVDAALVMAALRTALRAASPSMSPAERMRCAEQAMSTMVDLDSGLFVTAFHARLHLPTGEIRYVDAGHGHWAVRRSSGELITISERHPTPLFALPDSEIFEGRARLEPDDTLVIYSDGLIEIGDQSLSLDDYRPEMEGVKGAEALVSRLLRRLPTHLSDDVTVVAVHRSR
jgi:PAS domain S-box-containing protein